MSSSASFDWLNRPDRQHAGLSEGPHARTALNWRASTFACAAIYLILPNLPLLISSRGLGATTHGFINIEYLLIGAVCAFLPRCLAFLLLALESLADFAYSICYTYQFSLRDLVSSLRYLLVLPGARVASVIAFLSVVLLISVTLAFLRPHPAKHIQTAVVLLALAALLVPVDILGGQNPIWAMDIAHLPFRVVRSPSLTLFWREAKASRINAAARDLKNTPVPSASSEAISFLDRWPASLQSPNVVLVVVESWGLPLDAHLTQALAAPYDDPRLLSRYSVYRGTVPFTGLTVPGETRELCQSDAGFEILHASSEQAEHCLPASFHARGYQNIAIHGYIGQMFSRSTWYAKLGFDQSWFEPELTRAGLPRCRGAFPGICDASIGSWIGRSLLSSDQARPKFIYWVTLNAHIPVPSHPDLPDDGVCAQQPALRNSAPLCSWFRLVRVVHQSMQQAALTSTARPTVFLLVGDHAPPFSNPQRRGAFSRTDVPYVMLTPRTILPR